MSERAGWIEEFLDIVGRYDRGVEDVATSHLDTAAVHQRVAEIRQRARTPVAVGFGVKDATAAANIAAFADAVVIGSALVDTLAGSADADEAVRRARGFLAPIRAALDALPADHAA